jgi:hypothetical protein
VLALLLAMVDQEIARPGAGGAALSRYLGSANTAI